MSDVTLYTSTVCQLCDRTKLRLWDAEIDFDIVNLDLPGFEEARTYVTQVLGAKSVPVVVSDVHPPIIGYQPDKLKRLIAALTDNGGGDGPE